MTKTWMITGSSRGFGRRLAEAVLEAGDNLVATARSTGSLKDLAETYGGRLPAVTLHAYDPGARHAHSRAQDERNLWGVINVPRAARPVLHAQRSGHIIQFSSVGGRLGTPGLGAYQLSQCGSGG